MKIGEFEFPDKCSENCPFLGDIGRNGQNSICGRCPVFCCTPVEYEGEMICMIDPADYREDWAEEWAKFFEDGTFPMLKLKLERADGERSNR